MVLVSILVRLFWDPVLPMSHSLCLKTISKADIIVNKNMFGSLLNN